MNVRYNYNRQISPPAPFAHVSIGRPDGTGANIESLPAQLDSAADISVIPTSLVERLQLVQLDQAQVTGFGGHVVTVATYAVRIQLHQFAPLTVRVLADRDEPFVILGRDILNRYEVMLDGPSAVVEIASP